MKILIALFFTLNLVAAEPADSVMKKLIHEGLSRGEAFAMLSELCLKIGARLSGSDNLERATLWGAEQMKRMGFENVHLEAVMVPLWVRGDERLKITDSPNARNKSLNICALGGSVGTAKGGITAEIIEVKSFEELQTRKDEAKGKLIFFNRPMDPTFVSPFDSYVGAVNQRGYGAVEAAKVGALGAIVRSMTMANDDEPHTGAMRYDTNYTKLPAAAIGIKSAEFLSDLLKKEPHLKLNLELGCKILPDVPSANVVGEIRGSERPDEVIVMGGHLDSWDKGQGAHDDGAGIAHSLEALRLIKASGLKPKRTIRVVLFTNEENGVRGGNGFATVVRPNEKTIAAIESDAGGFAPIGFSVDSSEVMAERLHCRAGKALSQIWADRIVVGHGGTDIEPLKKKYGTLCIGLRPSPHRYMDYHHSNSDTIDKVNPRELELGAIAMAMMGYVLSEYGVE